MTLAAFSAPYKLDYIAGGQTNFPYTFRILSASHVAVYVSGVQVFNYSVTGVGVPTGGTIIFNAPPLVDSQVTITRNVPNDQSLDYVDASALPAEGHETALDKITMQIQMLQEQVYRSLKLPVEAVGIGPAVGIPSPEAFLRWDITATHIESVNVGTLGSLPATVSPTGVVFGGGGGLNTNLNKFAWDNTTAELKLLGDATIKMVGGIYTPDIGGPEFKMLTIGSSVMAAGQGLRRATISLYDTNAADDDNALLYLNVYAPAYIAPTYKKTGIHVNAFTLPDNGGDTSGILTLQTGGGNALTAYKVSYFRPAGAPNYRDSTGMAAEIGTNDNGGALLIQTGLNNIPVFGPLAEYPQGLVMNLNTPTAKGIIVQPGDGIFDTRIAFQVGQYNQGLPNTVIAFTVDLLGNIAAAGNISSGADLSIGRHLTFIDGLGTVTQNVTISGTTLVFHDGILVAVV